MPPFIIAMLTQLLASGVCHSDGFVRDGIQVQAIICPFNGELAKRPAKTEPLPLSSSRWDGRDRRWKG